MVRAARDVQPVRAGQRLGFFFNLDSHFDYPDSGTQVVKEVRQMVFAAAFFHAAISVFYDVGFHGLHSFRTLGELRRPARHRRPLRGLVLLQRERTSTLATGFPSCG